MHLFSVHRVGYRVSHKPLREGNTAMPPTSSRYDGIDVGRQNDFINNTLETIGYYGNGGAEGIRTLEAVTRLRP